MSKVLFVPTNSREVVQFNLVTHELDKLNCQTYAIATSEELWELLQGKSFSGKRLIDYKTLNVLNVIKKEKPDIVVTDFCGPTANAFIFAANHLRIPTLQIDDGVTADYSALRNVPLRRTLSKLSRMIIRGITLIGNPKPYLYLLTALLATENPFQFLRKAIDKIVKLTYPVPSYAEGLNIAVMGPLAKEAYIKMGVPPEKVYVTGQPGFDLILQRKFDEKHIRGELGIPDDKGIVVLATQPLIGSLWREEDRENFVKTVTSAMEEFPEKQLVLKLHPDESMEDYRALLAKLGYNKAILCQTTDLYELLHACDLLMTVHSTVALEAMLFNKPVICIDLAGRQTLTSFYTESGAAVGVYREEDLVPAIQKTLYDPRFRKEVEDMRKEFIHKHAYIQDGKASKRAADLIMKLIKESKAEKDEA